MKFWLILFVSIYSIKKSYSHGEKDLGPNGGIIRMPSSFHTELVKVTDKKIRIYLLDINWKNPIVRNSSVDLSFYKKNKSLNIRCIPRKVYFECDLKENILNFDFLKLKSKRDGIKGLVVEYKIPSSIEDKDMHH